MQHWHSHTPEEVLAHLESSPEGLSDEQVRARLERHGPNRLKPTHRRGPLRRFLAQFHNVLIYLLLLAAGVTAVLSIVAGPEHWIDTGVIVAVVVINAVIGFVQEGKAEQALDAIRKMLSQEARVIRGGKRVTVEATDLVPGDVVELRAGDKVAADLRLLESRELRIDEAILTGESVPDEKDSEPVEQDAALGDRSSIAFSGTLVTSGQGLGVVVTTGDHTEIGRISEMVSETETLTTPLIRQMDRFGHILAVVIVVFASAAFAFGTLLGGWNAIDMFLASVALAVAAIPEGLPAIMTIVLAIGVRRMAGRQAIIRRLAAVDTLGALTVICSDKTGTLTRNEMTVTAVVTRETTFSVTGVGYEPAGELRHGDRKTNTADHPVLEALLQAAVLCNDSDLSKREGQWISTGDPMEGALLTLARKAGIDPERERKAWKTRDTIPFESKNRFMATLHHDGHAAQAVIYVKGAPERMLEMCSNQQGASGPADRDRAYWQEQADDMARVGRRVLALGFTHVADDHEQLNTDQVESGLTMLGLVGIIDPPRNEAIEAVQHCHEAGIRVVMITGDHSLTARAIGKELRIGDGEKALRGADLEKLDEHGLRDAAGEIDVFARVSPEHKLRLVAALQARGEVVGMTGDGVNDAPALKRADVGIAMGIKGTEVSKEAAEMVLADDNFASIAHAVEEGRTVYDNLRKSILFILPTSGGEALSILVAILLGRALPLTPTQVLWVNMITAVTLALALAFEPPEVDVMKRRPRDPKGQLISGYFLWRIVFVSVILGAGTFGMFTLMIHWGMELTLARTVAVNTLVLFEVFYLLNCRFILNPVIRFRDLIGNRLILLTIALVMGFQMLFTYLPVMQRLFGTAPMSPSHWGLAALVASSVYFLVEIEKTIARRMRTTT